MSWRRDTQGGSWPLKFRLMAQKGWLSFLLKKTENVRSQPHLGGLGFWGMRNILYPDSYLYIFQLWHSWRQVFVLLTGVMVAFLEDCSDGALGKHITSILSERFAHVSDVKTEAQRSTTALTAWFPRSKWQTNEIWPAELSGLFTATLRLAHGAPAAACYRQQTNLVSFPFRSQPGVTAQRAFLGHSKCSSSLSQPSLPVSHHGTMWPSIAGSGPRCLPSRSQFWFLFKSSVTQCPPL